MASNAQVTVNPILYDKMPFDPLRDLEAISQAVFTPNILVVNKDVPATTVQELVGLARARPGRLTFGSAGVGTTQHLAGELFRSLAHLDIRHVAYRGAVPVITDLLGGHVTMFFGSASPLIPLIREGKLRALAVTSTKRFSTTPDVPTMIEAGFASFDASASFGLMSPAGTPRDVIEKIHRDTVKALALPDVRKRLAEIGMDAIGNSPEEFSAALKAEIPQWTSLIKEIGLAAKEKSPFRVGFLSPGDGPGPNHKAFIEQLRKLGYEQGRNLFVDWRWLAERYGQLPDVAAEMTRSGADVLVGETQAVATALHNNTKYIPIVFVDVRDPVVAGLVTSMNMPGANVTGVTLTPTAELAAKQVELLRELVPGAKRVAIFWNPAATVEAQVIETIRSASQRLAVSVHPFEVRDRDEIERAFEEIAHGKFDGLAMLVESLTLSQRALIAERAIRIHLPTVFEVRDYVDAGGLVSYGVQYNDHYARAAMYVDKILRGASPADLPVEQPSRFDFVINMITARSIGIEMPASVVARATEVIE